jgi:hypothetical protein
MEARDHTPVIVQKSNGGGGFMTYIAFVPWDSSLPSTVWILQCSTG